MRRGLDSPRLIGFSRIKPGCQGLIALVRFNVKKRIGPMIITATTIPMISGQLNGAVGSGAGVGTLDWAGGVLGAETSVAAGVVSAGLTGAVEGGGVETGAEGAGETAGALTRENTPKMVR
jgi:hypothetical protein